MTHMAIAAPLHEIICQECPARNISFCNILKKKDLNHLSAIMTHFHKPPKQIIIEEGQKAEYLYNICSGTVMTSKMLADGRRQITGFLSAGELFGSPLNNQGTYSYTTEAITDVEICRFSITKITEIFQEFPQLKTRTFDITQAELKASYDLIMLLGQKTAIERLCSFLLLMKAKANLTSNDNKNTLHLPMKRLDIADFLGLTIETISRQFAKLCGLNLIELDGPHNIRLINIESLIILAGDN